MEEGKMIEVENLFKIFGNKPEIAMKLIEEGYSKKEILSKTGQVVAINGISFTLRKGETFVLMGLSGSGKSTILRCINKLIEPTMGNIYLNYKDKKVNITDIEKKELLEIRKNYMSMIFQHFALFPWRTVNQNIVFGMEIQGVKKETASKRSKKILELVGLKEWNDSMPSELSGGMRQRVGLARALATGAPILLMDEPFSALDPLIKVKMQDELIKLQKKLKKTIIFVTHDLDEALKLGDKIAIMENGKLVQIGIPEEIIISPKTEYVAKFVEHADVSNVLTAKSVAKNISNFNIKKNKNHTTISLDKSNTIRFFYDNKEISKIEYNNCLYKPRQLNTKNDINDISNDYIYLVDDTISIKLIMEARVNSKLPVFLISEDNKINGIIREKEIFKSILRKN